MRWWVSAKFMPARVTPTSTSPVARLRRRQLDQLEHLGPAELLIWIARIGGRLPHAARTAGTLLSPDPTGKTPRCRSPSSARSHSTPSPRPFGSREKMLGGSAVHFSLASSFFTDVRVVGPVGDDFGDEEYGVLHGRGVDHRRHRARPRRRDVLLARPLRVRPQHRAHRRHAAERLRRLRAEALGGLARLRRAVPREHPARPPARGARAVRAARSSSRSTR